MSDKKIKVIDRRMFTPDGELRDAYRGQVDPDRAPEREPAVVVPPADPRPEPTPPPESATRRPASSAPEPPPAEDDDPDAPKFGDLVGLLAQTGAAYIQQARATASPDLMQMARLHVDLLDVLEQKTAGNLTLEETQILQDVKRQLGIALG